jgi:SAM-dependent methyltransferase
VLLRDDVRWLRCTECQHALAFRGSVKGARLGQGVLGCKGCDVRFRVDRGIARLYAEERVRGTDRLLRVMYDGLPAVHDPLVRLSFPIAVGESEEVSRSRYLERIALDALRAPRGRAPLRILEVGIGTGSNVPLIRQRVPRGVPIQIWGVDLSLGMLGQLEKRMRFLDDSETRYLAADAHALPFPAAFFDRVLHVGAINGYRDPATALSEMARVARPGTPIVVVDERLDPDRRHGLLHRLFFKLMTIYDRDPHAPVEHLPAGATRVTVDQLGRFFYCLTFRMPARAPKRKPARPVPAKRPSRAVGARARR